jgi:hypothetical protein
VPDIEKYLAYDFEFTHIVKEIATPVTLYSSPESTEGKCIKISAVWDTGATHSVISPKTAKQLDVEPVDKCLVSDVYKKNKTSDVIIATIILPNGTTMYGKRFSINDIPGTDVLIGMDIISMGDFVITNASGKTMFSFIIPTLNKKISLKELAMNI